MLYLLDSLSNTCYNIRMNAPETMPPKTKGSNNPDLPLSLTIDDTTKKDFYLSLATKNYVDAAKAIGLDKRYTTENSLRTIAFKLFKSIDPNTLGISNDAVQIVRAALDDRRAKAHTEITDGSQPELLNPDDAKQLVIGGRNKAAILLHKKMDAISKSKRQLEDVTLSQLATTFGIFFDKSQILRGEATENIAVMAKVNPNMTPEESLEALLKMREVDQEQKHG